MRTSLWRAAGALGAAAALAASVTAAGLPKPGAAMPAWSGKTIAGKPISSAQYRGKALLINFFGFNWSACHEEYPHLQTLQKKYGPRGFTVISVSLDESVQEAGAFAKEVRATFPVVHDPKTALFEKFGVAAMPTNIVVNRQGKIVASIEGADLKALEAAVQKAVAAK